MNTSFSRRRFVAGAVLGLGALTINPLLLAWQAHAAHTILIAYFSWSGNTRRIAELLHRKIGGDLVEIRPAVPYSDDYNTCLDQAKRDREQEARPVLATHIENMDRYDVVFLGYPNWWAGIPMPIATFLEQYDFNGKTIIPFVSHGGGRLGQSISDIAKLCPTSRLAEALSVRYSGGRSLSADMDAWLKRLGMPAA